MNYIRHHSRCPVCAGRLVHEINNLVNSDIADRYSALNLSDISSIHIRASKKCRNSGTETGCLPLSATSKPLRTVYKDGKFYE